MPSSNYFRPLFCCTQVKLRESKFGTALVIESSELSGGYVLGFRWVTWCTGTKGHFNIRMSIFPTYVFLYIWYRVFIKNCVFSQFTATHPLLEGEQLIWSEILVYSHSYWLAIFFPTNSSPVLARERSQNIENSWKKNTTFNEHSVLLRKSLNFHIGDLNSR